MVFIYHSRVTTVRTLNQLTCHYDPRRVPRMKLLSRLQTKHNHRTPSDKYAVISTYRSAGNLVTFTSDLLTLGLVRPRKYEVCVKWYSF